MNLLKNQPAALFALWLVLVVVSLFSRTYIPIDETRYVTVAWNMWLRGDYLVPWLNGEAYSHKPPLLFWLMNAGWAAFGVNDWWPRLVPSFFALGSVFLTIRLARMLWPEDRQAYLLAPVILLGSALWTVFTTATMFDMLIAFFTLLGMIGIVDARQGRPLKGWLLVGLSIGMGLLAKGPTILLQVLPAALLASWWCGGNRQSWARWYGGILAAILLGAVIALLWAIPAGMRGGEEYRNAIFWGQTAERMVNSFAHKRPLWWYLPLLPVILFPWLFWLPVWLSLKRLRQNLDDTGIRLCLAWSLSVFLAFCLISGKQMHYLLPIFPAFALMVARTLPQVSQNCLPRVWRMALFSAAAVVLVVYGFVIHGAGLAYDVRPLAARLKTLQDAGIPLAHAGDYPGQYQFLGRMVDEPEVVKKSRLGEWFQAHPDGKALVYFDTGKTPPGFKPDYQQPYLDENVAIVGRESWPAPKPRAP